MAPYEQNETRAYLKLVMTTLSLIGVLTVINGVIILNSVGTNIFKPLQRNIASVAKTEPVDLAALQPPIVAIDCAQSPEKFEITTKAVNTRFTFKNCPKIEQIINHANANEGDVFHLADGSGTSDFISLLPGKNKISASLGKKTQVIEIYRENLKPTTPQKPL